MRKLVLLAAVVALLVAADVGARRAAEAQLERRIREQVPSARQVSAHIDSFPFLVRLGATGRIAEVRASLADVTVSNLRVASVAVDLSSVHLDRSRLVLHRQVDIHSIGPSTATADIAQADLRRALGGVPVILGDGKIGVMVRGLTLSATATVRNNVLRLSAGGFSLPALRIPELPLLPCVTQAVALPGRLHLSCAVQRVPDELIRRVKGEQSTAAVPG